MEDAESKPFTSFSRQTSIITTGINNTPRVASHYISYLTKGGGGGGMPALRQPKKQLRPSLPSPYASLFSQDSSNFPPTRKGSISAVKTTYNGCKMKDRTALDRSKPVLCKNGGIDEGFGVMMCCSSLGQNQKAGRGSVVVTMSTYTRRLQHTNSGNVHGSMHAHCCAVG